MAKKKTIKPKKTFTREEIQTALEITHQEYFMSVLALLSHLPEDQDLAFVKTPVVTPDGGNYLISILHIDGPKINLQKLSQGAEAIEAEKEKA